jgi:hypothetical protein
VTTVIIEPAAEAAEPAEIEPAAEAPQAEAVEAAGEAAVEIAQIEADRDVTLAVIEGENDAARIEAMRDERIDALELELAQCRTTISTLEMELQTRPALVLEAPPSPEPAPSLEAITSESPIEQTPVEPPKRRRRLRLI